MKGRILVVDDSPTIRSRFEWLLTHHGYGVHVAQDGLSALSAVKSYKPSLIVLDIVMPVVSGVQVCQVLRQDVQYDDVPIILISGVVDRSEIDQALAAGADDFLMKPVQDDELINSVELHLARIIATN